MCWRAALSLGLAAALAQSQLLPNAGNRCRVEDLGECRAYWGVACETRGQAFLAGIGAILRDVPKLEGLKILDHTFVRPSIAREELRCADTTSKDECGGTCEWCDLPYRPEASCDVFRRLIPEQGFCTLAGSCVHLQRMAENRFEPPGGFGDYRETIRCLAHNGRENCPANCQRAPSLSFKFGIIEEVLGAVPSLVPICLPYPLLTDRMPDPLADLLRVGPTCQEFRGTVCELFWDSPLRRYPCTSPNEAFYAYMGSLLARKAEERAPGVRILNHHPNFVKTAARSTFFCAKIDTEQDCQNRGPCEWCSPELRREDGDCDGFDRAFALGGEETTKGFCTLRSTCGEITTMAALGVLPPNNVTFKHAMGCLADEVVDVVTEDGVTYKDCATNEHCELAKISPHFGILEKALGSFLPGFDDLCVAKGDAATLPEGTNLSAVPAPSNSNVQLTANNKCEPFDPSLCSEIWDIPCVNSADALFAVLGSILVAEARAQEDDEDITGTGPEPRPGLILNHHPDYIPSATKRILQECADINDINDCDAEPLCAWCNIEHDGEGCENFNKVFGGGFCSTRTACGVFERFGSRGVLPSPAVPISSFLSCVGRENCSEGSVAWGTCEAVSDLLSIRYGVLDTAVTTSIDDTPIVSLVQSCFPIFQGANELEKPPVTPQGHILLVNPDDYCDAFNPLDCVSLWGRICLTQTEAFYAGVGAFLRVSAGVSPERYESLINHPYYYKVLAAKSLSRCAKIDNETSCDEEGCEWCKKDARKHCEGFNRAMLTDTGFCTMRGSCDWFEDMASRSIFLPNASIRDTMKCLEASPARGCTGVSGTTCRALRMSPLYAVLNTAIYELGNGELPGFVQMCLADTTAIPAPVQGVLPLNRPWI